MSTPHNRAEKGDFAKTVLMPGDPLRAKFIAETFLENPRLVTDVRGMYGFIKNVKIQWFPHPVIPSRKVMKGTEINKRFLSLF